MLSPKRNAPMNPTLSWEHFRKTKVVDPRWIHHCCKS